MPDFSREKKIKGPVAGIDEAGRGPLAGPVVAAAVILNGRKLPLDLDDSKALSAAQREKAFASIQERAIAIGVGRAEVSEIDHLNILHATMLAMQRAVAALRVAPMFALVDGNRLPHLPCPGEAVVEGDAKSVSIAAASIIAKVLRDREMRDLDALHPGYGWAKNKGYGTAEHLAALHALGPSPQHRRSFAPVAQLLLPLKAQP